MFIYVACLRVHALTEGERVKETWFCTIYFNSQSSVYNWFYFLHLNGIKKYERRRRAFITKSKWIILFTPSRAFGNFHFRNNVKEDLVVYQSNYVVVKQFSHVNTFVGFMLNILSTKFRTAKWKVHIPKGTLVLSEEPSGCTMYNLKYTYLQCLSGKRDMNISS